MIAREAARKLFLDIERQWRARYYGVPVNEFAHGYEIGLRMALQKIRAEAQKGSRSLEELANLLSADLLGEAPSQPAIEKFVVRHWDGFENNWLTVSEPVTREEAERILAEMTEEGRRHTRYQDIDYYKIFPADTTMQLSAD